MICDHCGKVPATQAQTLIENGKKHVVYSCATCADLTTTSSPKLDRPCEQCGQREGRIKLARVRPQGRVITYICDTCAAKR